MNTISINDNKYSGNNIIVTNGKVIINGKDVTPESKEININVEGNIDELKVDACNKVFVNGNIDNLKIQSGDVDITGDITGNIEIMSGDVNCGMVGGSISTMSCDVKYRHS